MNVDLLDKDQKKLKYFKDQIEKVKTTLAAKDPSLNDKIGDFLIDH